MRVKGGIFLDGALLFDLREAFNVEDFLKLIFFLRFLFLFVPIEGVSQLFLLYFGLIVMEAVEF